MDARAGRIPARTQSSLAISADGSHWFLINASPDLRQQLGAFDALHPSPGTRNSRIAGVLITNADLDHTLGLLLLREGPILDLYATGTVRETLTQSFPVDRLLRTFAGIRWQGFPYRFSPLNGPDALDRGLEYRAIYLPGHPPRFAVRDDHMPGHSVALQFRSRDSGHSVVIAPSVPTITEALLEAMRESKAVFIDGTFWDSNELARLPGSSRTADDMGHLPVSVSLPALAQIRCTHKVYIHINNTNPILQPDSPERKQVEAAGVRVGDDGLEIEI